MRPEEIEVGRQPGIADLAYAYGGEAGIADLEASTNDYLRIAERLPDTSREGNGRA